MDVEAKILSAAREIFLAEGFGGARMQAIADRAGVNKALLHYYFRSKEKLYEAAFQGATGDFEAVFRLLDAPETSIPEKVNAFVLYCQESQLSRPGEFLLYLRRLSEAPMPVDLSNSTFLRQLREGQSLGLLKKVQPENVLRVLFALCLYPMVAPPALAAALPGSSGDERESLRLYYESLPVLIMDYLRL